MKVAVIAVSVALIATASVSWAQTPEDDSGLRANCAGDYFRFCAAYMPGSTAIRGCFKQNFRQLSPGCQSAISSFDRRARRF